MEVAFSEEGRATTSVTKVQLTENQSITTNVTKDSVFLVSGGAKGVTATCVIEMAKAFQCKFILLGRSDFSFEVPEYAKNEDDEGGKNMHEKDFLEAQLKRLGKNVKWSYNKITNVEAGKKLADQFHQWKDNDVNFIVYNFVDMLSHARTEMEVIRELADNEAAYRSITTSWLEHSPLLDILKKIAEAGHKLIITTDHGTIKVTKPVRIVGERNTNSNLRYKAGRGLSYDAKEVFVVKNPQEAQLPKLKLSAEFVFAREQDFFVYPNNYNHFVNYYGHTFQHGGISLEEILIPFVELTAK